MVKSQTQYAENLFLRRLGAMLQPPDSPIVILSVAKDLCSIKMQFVLCEILRFAQNDRHRQKSRRGVLVRNEQPPMCFVLHTN